MLQVLAYAQISVGVFLSGLILLQAKGVGLGRSFGSSNYHSKRGVERITFRATIVLAVLFVILSFLKVIL